MPFKLRDRDMGVVTVDRSIRPPSLSTRHVAEWAISNVSSDLTIEVGATSFPLHKFHLASRSGKIRKLLLERQESKISRLILNGVPGGAEAFELAAKFCYGVNNIEIKLSNVAMFRCVAHFLEMKEEFSEKNLEAQTEAYLKENVFSNICSSISVLHCCENLLPVSEEVNLVNHLINAIASISCKEQLTSGLSKLEYNIPSKPIRCIDTENSSQWWGTSLAVLNLGFFKRVVIAVKTKGLNQDIISRILINYAQNSIQGSDLHKKRRVIVETVVSLLPTQSRKSVVPMAFLSSLLKSAIPVKASTSTISDLERRIGLQLDQAILEDILIPTNSQGNNHSLLYDIDTILRIFSIFLKLDEEDKEDDQMGEENDIVYGFDSPGSPKHRSVLKVSKLMDNYLAEVALDSNLTASKFIALVELLPDHARAVYDGLYRAVDIFLQVHPNINDSERYQLCKTINFHKLSQEACSQAAQNERLPVQMAVQILYFEQIRLKHAMNRGHTQSFIDSTFKGHFSQRCGSGPGSGCVSPRDNYASVRRENKELKLEVARMRMRLTDLEKDHNSMKQEMVRPNPTNKLFKSFTKKLNSWFKFIDFKPNGGKGKAHSKTRFPFQKRRSNSMS